MPKYDIKPYIIHIIPIRGTMTLFTVYRLIYTCMKVNNLHISVWARPKIFECRYQIRGKCIIDFLIALGLGSSDMYYSSVSVAALYKKGPVFIYASYLLQHVIF